MTAQHDVTMRPITGVAELDLFCRIPYSLNEELADDLATRRRRPEWMWVALRGDELLARVAWWSRPGDDAPVILDVVDVAAESDRVNIGVQLLRTAMDATLPAGSHPPEYSRFVAPDWRETPASKQVVDDRMAVLEQVGAEFFVERLRLEWRPGSPVPEPSQRLRFRPVEDTAELLDLMTAVLDGTLDAHSRDDLTWMSARESAVEQYESEFARCTSPQNWWRIATLPDGEPMGFVIPTHNGYNATIAYIAVLPAHRGNGYIDDILAEGTRVLVEQDVPRIRAATDLGNTPMAKAFHRAGYVNFQCELKMTWN
ncbi:GNAT family N-acetyltransferase [Saccharopolyspora sp. NPDC002376]